MPSKVWASSTALRWDGGRGPAGAGQGPSGSWDWARSPRHCPLERKLRHPHVVAKLLEGRPSRSGRMLGWAGDILPHCSSSRGVFLPSSCTGMEWQWALAPEITGTPRRPAILLPSRTGFRRARATCEGGRHGSEPRAGMASHSPSMNRPGIWGQVSVAPNRIEKAPRPLTVSVHHLLNELY